MKHVLTWSTLIPVDQIPASPPNETQGLLYAGTVYAVMIGDANRSLLSFTVNPDGTLSFDPAVGGNGLVASGNNTPNLKIEGFAVTIDSRYITGPLFQFANIPNFCYNSSEPFNESLQFITGNLLPGLYPLQIGSGMVPNFNVEVDSVGNFNYDPVLDIAPGGGPLSGAGTATLEILGIPVLIDARAAVTSVVLPDSGIGSTTGVLFVDLLPYFNYSLELDGVVQSAAFSIDQSGTITLLPASPYTMTLGEFHGLARITINRENG